MTVRIQGREGALFPSIMALVLGLLSFPLSFSVQATEAPSAPKIGLVLSGGGAKGLAHVGVLKALQEMHIPVHVVVGTSAGSAVGAVYAMGLPISTIEKRFEDILWDSGFEDESSRDAISFRRKQEQADKLDLEVGVGWQGIKGRKGFIQGQELQLILNDLLKEAVPIRDFDYLPIPYRAVAADLETGESVAMGEGNIVDAVRASMAIPAVYPPVEWQGRLLVDGGIANNLPIDVARNLGADVIIAVDISTPLAKKGELDGALAVVDQLTNLLTRRNVETQIATLGPRDILITPDLNGASSGDFDRALELVELGATATRQYAVQLLRYQMSDDQWLAYEQQRTLLPENQARLVAIDVRNRSHVSDDFILSRIRQKVGQPLNRKKLDADLRAIYGLGYFESVRYDLTPGAQGPVLVIEAEEKSWGPDYLRFGLAYEDGFRSENYFNLSAAYNMTAINSLGAEWSTEAGIGDEPYLSTEYYQPLSFLSRYFVTVGAGFDQRIVNGFENGERTRQVSVDTLAVQLGIGRELNRWSEFRVFVQRAEKALQVEIGVDAGLQLEVDEGFAAAQFAWDSFDSVAFPREGAYARLLGRFYRPDLGSDSHFDRTSLMFAKAISLDRYTLLGRLSASVVTQGQAGIEHHVRLGGHFNLSGYSRDEFGNQDGGFAALTFYRQFGSRWLPYYLGLNYEAGAVWEDIRDARSDDWRDAWSLFVGVDTLIGPITMSYSYGDADHQSVVLTMGHHLQDIFD